MNRRMPLLVVAGAAALAITGLFGAVGAVAAEPGQLYIVGYADQTLVTGMPTAPTGLTEIVNAIPELAGFFVTGGDVAVGGSTAYLIGTQSGVGCALLPLNLVTGAASTPVGITIAGTMDPVQNVADCEGFDIAADGTAWLSGVVPETGDSLLYTVDLSTSVATQIGFLWDSDNDSAVRFTALASSAEGTLYGVTEFGEIYLIDPETAVVPTDTVEATWLADSGIFDSGWNWNADFDANGTLWLNTYGDEDEGGPLSDLLWSFDVTTPATPATSSGALKQGDRFVDTGALFFGPAVAVEEPAAEGDAALAETGADPLLGLLAGGALLVFGASAIVMVRRRVIA